MKTKSARRRRTSGPVSTLSVASDATEPEKWALQEGSATAALKFWEGFLDLRRAGTNIPKLSDADRARLLCIVRAVSWVESSHGTGTGVQPARDPAQCGNPNDAWWKELNLGPGKGSFFKGGPDAPDRFASDLPGQTESTAGFPKGAKFSQLADPTKGHKNVAFAPITSGRCPFSCTGSIRKAAVRPSTVVSWPGRI